MNGFLANPPAPVPADELPIENDGWFPDINLATLRRTARLDGTVTPDRLRHSALDAVRSINRELFGLKSAQLVLGRGALEEVPAGKLDGVSVHVSAYLRAVYCLTQADLVERYRDFDTTGAGDKAAEKLECRIDGLRRDARWAISDLRGMRRTVVDLI